MTIMPHVQTMTTPELFTSAEWRAWIAGHRNAHTRRTYAADLRSAARYLSEVCGVTDLRDVRVQHVYGYPSYLAQERGFAGATIRRKITALRVAMDYLVALYPERHLINPMTTIKSPRVPNISPRHPLTAQQVRALLAQPDVSTVKGVRDHAVLVCLLYLAVRCAEVCDLRLGWFGRVGEHVVVQIHGKGEKVRELPIIPLVAQAVRAYLARAGRPLDDLGLVPPDRADEPLFYPLRNNRTSAGNTKTISEVGLWKVVKLYAAQARIVTDVHTLRLTAATQAIANGVDINDLMEFLGHSDIRTTQRYIKRAGNLDRSAAYRLHYT